MDRQKSAAKFLSGGVGRALLLVSRLILGGVFLYAGYAKLHFGGAWHLSDYQFLFAIVIDSYKMVSFATVNWMARVLPWAEVVLGALLLIGIGLRWIASATVALLVVFMIALTHAVMLRLEICGCYGTNSVTPAEELRLDALLLLLAVFLTVGAFLTHGARRITAA
jgi:uncharacterized membrane protein YphA (DoxX/SURF4 family)